MCLIMSVSVLCERGVKKMHSVSVDMSVSLCARLCMWLLSLILYLSFCTWGSPDGCVLSFVQMLIFVCKEGWP